MEPKAQEHRSVARWVTLAGLLALALRLWGLSSQSIWIDEFFSLKYAQIGRSLTWDALRFNLHGPPRHLLRTLLVVGLKK